MSYLEDPSCGCDSTRGLYEPRHYAGNCRPFVPEPTWLPKQKPILTREVIVKPLRGDEPTTLNRWLFGLFVAVVMMGLVSIPLAVITHELAAHGWLDRVGP